MKTAFSINANTIDTVNNFYEPTDKSEHNQRLELEVIFRSFIGHSTKEAPVGIVLQEYIENSFPSLSQCFLSRSNLLAGDQITEQILDVLASTRLHIVIFSPASINRHWLHLEAGAALLRRVPLVGVTHSGLAPSELPDPYRSYLAVEIDTLDGVERLCKTLAQRGKVPPPNDLIIRRFFERLQKACKVCSS